MSNSREITLCLAAAGRRVHLMETLRADAIALGLRPRFLALDRDPELSAACHAADIAEAVPACSDPGYVDAVLAACHRHGARVVVPTIDLDLQAFADARASMSAAGVTPLISSPEAVRIARDKLRTFEVLSSAGLPVPATHTLAEALASPNTIGFPAVIKPMDGSSSRGLHFLAGWDDLPKPAPAPASTLLQERCLGPEYTVNAYVDMTGTLRCAVPHRRLEVRGGEVSKARTERHPGLVALARDLARAVPGLRGPFCFQCILTTSGPRIFEINARFGGGYPIAHAAGATFGKWALQEILGLPTTFDDNWTDGLLMLRHDSAVFVNPAGKATLPGSN